MTPKDKAVEVLNAYLKESSLSDCDIDLVPATSVGENFASTIFRAKIKNARLELSVIVKVAPESKALRLIFPIRGLYEQEEFYYRCVLPELETLQKEHKILNGFCSYPKYLKLQSDPYNEVFIFEDMKELGYSVLNRTKPIDYDHSVLVIREYAKLHGAAYALKKLKPNVFEQLAANARDKVFGSMILTDLKKAQLKERTMIALKSLDPVKHKEAYDRFLKFSETMFYGVQDAHKIESAGDYAVFTHGDNWICNYLFKYQDGVPKKLCLIDWQLAHCGSPALDLSHFFFCCTDQEFRKRHYEELIQVYYKHLGLYLQQVGCDVERVLPFDVLKTHLAKFSVYGVYMSTIVLNVTLLQGDNLPSLQNATQESDILKLRNVKDSSDLELYNSRMRGIILDFIEYGYDLCA